MQDENPFTLLGLTIDADDTAIRKSYHSLAMQWHPDKNPDRRAEAEEMFRRINEAYNILTDPDKKRRAVMASLSRRRVNSGPQSLPRNGRARANSFDQLFEETYGSDGDPPDSPLKRAPSSLPRTASGPVRDPSPFFDNGFGGESLDIRIEVLCTLEEMYQCVVKMVPLTRRKEDGTCETKNIRVTLKPGLENLAEIKLPRQGNQEWGRIPGDVVLVITEEPHERFTRSGDDIHQRIVVSLRDALQGKVEVESIGVDGELICAAVDEVIQPGDQLRVAEKGLNRPDGTRGDHVFDLTVMVPTLTPEQLGKVLEIL
jgi:DnaJ-class molecular chaperone